MHILRALRHPVYPVFSYILLAFRGYAMVSMINDKVETENTKEAEPPTPILVAHQYRIALHWVLSFREQVLV